MDETTDTTAAQALPVSYFGKLKAWALSVETEDLAEVHKMEQALLAAEHAAITDVEELIARIRGKI